jgi:hypothetical protein
MELSDCSPQARSCLARISSTRVSSGTITIARIRTWRTSAVAVPWQREGKRQVGPDGSLVKAPVTLRVLDALAPTAGACESHVAFSEVLIKVTLVLPA